MIRRRILAGLAAIGVVAVGFVVFGADDDAAEREYTAYLRSDEDGSAARNEARLDRAIGLEPGRSHYYEARGTLRIDAGDAEGALDDYDRAITLADRPYVRYLRASALSQRGDYLRALTDFDHAIAAQPSNTQFYRGRALARIAVGRPRGALADGERMVRDAPQVGVSYFARGSARAALGHDAAALRDLNEALGRSPESVYIWEAHAACSDRLGDHAGAHESRAEAERLAERGLARNPSPFRH